MTAFRIGARAWQQLSLTPTQEVFLSIMTYLFCHVVRVNKTPYPGRGSARRYRTEYSPVCPLVHRCLTAKDPPCNTLPVLGKVQKTIQFRPLCTLKWSQDTLVYTSTGIMANKDAGMSIDLGRAGLLQDDFIVHVAFFCACSFITWLELIYMKGH